MRRIRRIREKIVLHPIMTFVVLIFSVVLLSGILHFFDVNATYNRVTSTGAYATELVYVESLLNVEGLRFIFSNTVSNFAAFAPLSMLLIVLIGFGIMDKTGFLDTFFYLLTNRMSKRMVTFSLALMCILASIIGDFSFAVMIPFAALLFKYGKRHPKVGIICAFAALSCGVGINIVMNAVDASLIDFTLSSAHLLAPEYTLNVYASLFIMIFASIALALIITSVTEKIIAPKIGRFELDEDEDDSIGLSKREKKAIIISVFCGLVYVLIIGYNIIPGLPFSGNLLDNSQHFYIDKLFGYNSFFNQGFVFIVTFLFIILGLSYGSVTRSIKSHRDFCTSLSHSLDGVGKVILLILMASMFIFIFKATNIGPVVVAALSTLVHNSGFTGIALIILTFIVSAISTIVLPGTAAKWAILSGNVVPVFMNAGMSPTFATIVFRAGESITYALTPMMAYFVLYIAFMELYSKDDHDTLFGNIRHLMPYAIYTLILWLIILIAFYIIGIPLGIGSTPAL